MLSTHWDLFLSDHHGRILASDCNGSVARTGNGLERIFYMTVMSLPLCIIYHDPPT